MEKVFGKGVIKLKKGDIVHEDVNAIVNAANPSLMGGGGVDGAIHRAGGSHILEECGDIVRELPEGRLDPGKAVITSGGDLKAGYVIHAVGPIWRGGGWGESEVLKNVFMNSLMLARGRGLREISFPSISTGAYGYPVEEAASIAVGSVATFLEKSEMIVSFVLFDDLTFEAYKKALLAQI